MKKITNQDYLALNKVVSVLTVLLSFKKAMQQIKGENIVTRSCICPVLVSLRKALEQLKNLNHSYCENSAKTLQDSVSRDCCLFFIPWKNRLASLLDTRFKDKWIEDDVQKNKLCIYCKCMSLVGLVSAKKTVAAPAQMIKTKFLPESQSTFDFIAAGSKKQNLVI